jgi:hypothetical protein
MCAIGLLLQIRGASGSPAPTAGGFSRPAAFTLSSGKGRRILFRGLSVLTWYYNDGSERKNRKWARIDANRTALRPDSPFIRGEPSL